MWYKENIQGWRYTSHCSNDLPYLWKGNECPFAAASDVLIVRGRRKKDRLLLARKSSEGVAFSDSLFSSWLFFLSLFFSFWGVNFISLTARIYYARLNLTQERNNETGKKLRIISKGKEKGAKLNLAFNGLSCLSNELWTKEAFFFEDKNLFFGRWNA